MNSEQLDRFMTQVHEHYEQTGWHVQGVLGDENHLGFVYTVGLWKRYGHPEIIVFGLNPHVAHQILNHLGNRIAAGERFTNGTDDNVFERYQAAFKMVHDPYEGDYFNVAIAFYEHENFKAVQLFWPDPNGKFPWEKGFDESFRRIQPDLSIER